MLLKSQFLDLNNFRKLAILGKGEFGFVIKIEEKDTHKIFTAKIPNNIFIEKSYIFQEIKIMQMNHPSINKFIGFCPFDFENEPRPVIINEFYQNRSLRQVLDLKKSSQIPNFWNNTKKLINIYGISSALLFLHSQNIIHRDLKPSNILEDDHLYPQISDFGISRSFEQKELFDESNQNISSGTPFYMAPEVLKGNGYSTKSDVYSFSIIMYEIITNENPFQGLEIFDILTKIVQQNYRPKSDTSIPKCYRELMSKCWSENPNDRPTFNEIVLLLKQNSEFVTDFDVDKNEFFNYVEYVDSFNLKNKNCIELKGPLEKVSLFQSIQCRPFTITSQVINLTKFEKLERIGEGSRAIVHKIIFKENKQKFAAKILKKEFFKDFENERNSIILKNEVNILQKLNHPAIVKFIGYSPIGFNKSFNPVIVTELVSNRTLEQIIDLERNGLAREFWNETKKLINIYGIASSMSYLHSLNILHRNLKPSNILIDELFHPKLADFGFSKEISSNVDEDEGINEKPLVGAYTYIAPEVYSKLEYSKESDVYSFSFIVYEIITNQKPFLGPTVYQIMTNSVNCFRPSFNSNSLPNCYKKLIEACWAPDPKKRPSFNEILNYLKTEKAFLNESVNKEEFFDYVYKVDNFQNPFNPSKTLLKVDFESIYNKSNQQNNSIIKNGFVDLSNFKNKKKINEGEFSSTYNIVNKENNLTFSAEESNIEIHDLSNKDSNHLNTDFSKLLKLHHKSLLKFVGFNSTNFEKVEKPIFITEKQPSKTLENIIDIERNFLSIEGWNETKKLINIFGIASCMSYLHSNNILNQNLRPKNIFVDDFYYPKISKIGFYCQNQMKKCMAIQSIFGIKDNPAYYAPEIFISGQYTKACDVYSFGFIVYELLTIEKPFREISDPFEIIKEVVNNLGRPKIDSSIPSCYRELIQMCWKQNPKERPTFSQIVDSLTNDSNFITSDVNKQEYQQYIDYINNRTNNDSKSCDVESLKKAADKNDPLALFNIGLLYSRGQGVPKDKEKASYYYEKAAALGNTQAQYNLGLMYLKGDGVIQNKPKAAELFEMAANNGDTKAQFNLGIMYSKGNGVEKNYEKARELYEKAASLDDSEAQVNLGLMYDKGEGVPIDKEKAFELYTKSANKGNPIAQFNLAIMYQKGLEGILQKDNQKAIQLYQKAVDKGIAQAQFNLGVLYLNGDDDVPIDKTKAFQLFEMAANQGYGDAMLNLGLLYSNENKEKMIEWFNKAASQNHPKALFNLGLMYMKGENVERNPRKALEYYTRAAEQNLKQAKFNLGVLYFRGAEGVPRNKKKAAELFEEVSENNPKALFNLAIMYMNGDGVQKDEKRAVDYYEKAASLNNPDSLLNLGVIYDEGNCGIKKDKKKAFDYYKRAADLGNPKAQSNLGLMYQKGIGCNIDKEKSKFYYKMASDQGNDQAQLNLALLLFESEKFEDQKNALNYLKSSANHGNPQAMFCLARKYQQNNDIKSAIHYFVKSSNFGYFQSQVELGKIYLNGEGGIEKDIEKAEKYFQEAASHDIKEAVIYLSEIHEKDIKIEDVFDSIESKIKKIHFLISNEPFNDSKSSLSLLNDYFINQGLKDCILVNIQVNKSLKNIKNEFVNLVKDSNKSLLPSLNNHLQSSESIDEDENIIKKLQIEVESLETRLGQISKQIEIENHSPRKRAPTASPTSSPKLKQKPKSNKIKTPIPFSSKSSSSFRSSFDSQSSLPNTESNQIRNLMKKADDGDAKAQVALGAYYSTGRKVVKSYENALRYYLMAANQGNMNAQYAVGCFYYDGKGTKKNKKKAFDFFLLAANQGHVKAQFALGHFYQYDKDQNEANLKMAFEWYKKAADQGHEAAIQILKKEKYSPDE